MTEDKLHLHSEIVIGLVGSVGIDLTYVSNDLAEQFARFGYTVRRIKVSQKIIKAMPEDAKFDSSKYARTKTSMDEGVFVN